MPSVPIPKTIIVGGRIKKKKKDQLVGGAAPDNIINFVYEFTNEYIREKTTSTGGVGGGGGV